MSFKTFEPVKYNWSQQHIGPPAHGHIYQMFFITALSKFSVSKGAGKSGTVIDR
jgi:hypothetical protein